MSAIIVRVFPNPISSAGKGKPKVREFITSGEESPPLQEKKPPAELSPCCAAATGPGAILSDPEQTLDLVHEEEP